MHQPSLKMNISQNTILSMTQAPYNNLIINMAHLGMVYSCIQTKIIKNIGIPWGWKPLEIIRIT